MRDFRATRGACVFRPSQLLACYRFSDFGGWHGIPVGVCPARVELETMFCPVAAACDACGGSGGLHVDVEVRSTSYGERDVACATLCLDCAGGSFVQLLGSAGFSRAVLHHSRHLLHR
jgi:hypothetical protein